MKRIAIVDGVRTPFVKSFTEFQDLGASELGRLVVSELVARTEIDRDRIDEVIFGCVANPPEAANVARVIALLGGISRRKKAMTVSRNCASGFEAVTSAAEKIMTGVDRIVIAGGTESMSNIPMLYPKSIQKIFMELARVKKPFDKIRLMLRLLSKDLINPVVGLKLGLSDPVCGLNMGQTAEILAREFNISRLEQDEFSLRSHVLSASGKALRQEEIMSVPVKPEYQAMIDDDNGYRAQQSLKALAKLKPFFDRKNGTVTAGNSSQITDGASAMLLMSEEEAKGSGYDALGYLRAYAYEGLDPSRMGLGPAYAIPSALKKAGLALSDIGLIEINEAFAAQVIACERALDSEEFCRKQLGLSQKIGLINRDCLNVNGGGIALGHPVGATGNRMILTILKEMQRRNVQFGLASLCVGGGQGGAIVLERG